MNNGNSKKGKDIPRGGLLLRPAPAHPAVAVRGQRSFPVGVPSRGALLRGLRRDLTHDPRGSPPYLICRRGHEELPPAGIGFRDHGADPARFRHRKSVRRGLQVRGDLMRFKRAVLSGRTAKPQWQRVSAPWRPRIFSVHQPFQGFSHKDLRSARAMLGTNQCQT